MPHALEILDGSFAWMMKATTYTSIVIGLVLVVQWAVGQRLSARWRYALWLLVIVRALSPVLPASAWSVFNFAPSADRSSAMDEANVSPVASMPMVVETSVIREPAKVTIMPVESSQPSNWLAMAWFGGCVISCLFASLSAMLLGRRIRRATPVRKPEVIRLFDECRQLFGVQNVPEIVILPGISGPALAGVWRPRVLMPDGLIESLDERELRFVLLHELVHLKRRDLLVEWLLVLTRAVHWFNPLVWYAVARCRADRELACDENVLAANSDSAGGDYGRTILKLSQMLSIDRPSLVGAVRILENKSALKRRIHMIARFNAGRRNASAMIAGMSLLVLGACTLTDSKAQPAPQSNPADVREKPAAASNTMDMRIFHIGNLASTGEKPTTLPAGRLDELAKSVRELLAPSIVAAKEGATKPAVEVDARTSSLIVVASHADMERVAKLLGEQEAKGPQVMVATQYIAVDDAGLAALKQDVPEAFAGGSLPGEVGKKLFKAVSARAKEKAGVTPIATPRLLVTQGQKGSLLMGGETPYVGAIVAGKDETGKETYKPRIDRAVTGLSLDVSAKVDGERVTLDIHSAMRKVVAVRDKPFGKSLDGADLLIQVPESIGSEVTTAATLDGGQYVLVRGLRGSREWLMSAAINDRAAREPETQILLLVNATIVGSKAADGASVTPENDYYWGYRPSRRATPAKP